MDSPEPLDRVEPLRYADSVVVAAPPARVWELVSDVTRTGEWSPICRACKWDDPDAGPVVGATFTGHNRTPTRTWDTRCRVTASEPGRVFAWEVADGWVRWGYELVPHAVGTTLTETWEFTVAGQRGFVERYGDDAPAQVADRVRAAHTGIPATLAAIKAVAEG